MKEIIEAKELIAVAARQGVQLEKVEADVLLGYMEGHDYCLMRNEEFGMMLHDKQDGEEHSGDIAYTIRDVVEFGKEMNEELLLEAESKEQPDAENLLDLKKDEIILAGILTRAEAAVPATIREYRVVIVEHLKKTVPVVAASWAEATIKVQEAWENGDHVLGAEHFAGVTFTLGS